MNSNKELLEIYMKGFEDELKGKPHHFYFNDTSKRAYEIGRNHALLGDDLSSVDEMTEDEILNKIRNKDAR